MRKLYMAHEHSRTRNIIESFEAKALKKRRWQFKFADSVTSFFGSIPFLSLNIVYIAIMLVINTGNFPGINIFDPFPFVFLATTLTIEALVLMIIVLMSQIRQNQTATLRSELELQIGLITEKELTKLLKLVRLMLRKQGVKVINDVELEEMIGEIDASYIARKLEEEILPNEPNIVEKIEEKLEKNK